jgi:hypothetical protein
MGTEFARAQEVADVLKKHTKLTKEDIQLLRERAGEFPVVGGMNWLTARMELELIDAITSLDESTAKLTRIGVWLTAAGVFVGVVQIVMAFFVK